MNTYSDKTVPYAELQAALLARKYSEKLREPNAFPSEANWQYIIANRMTNSGIGRQLYHKYLVAKLTPADDRVQYHELALEYFPKYLRAIDYDTAVDVVYSDLETHRESALSLIESCQLQSIPHILQMVEDGDLDTACSLLLSFKREYTAADLQQMRRLQHKLTHLEPLGQVQLSRTMFGERERYICPQGHSNSAEELYCTHKGCGLNIYGLTREQQEHIEAFGERIDTLAEMLD